MTKDNIKCSDNTVITSVHKVRLALYCESMSQGSQKCPFSVSTAVRIKQLNEKEKKLSSSSGQAQLSTIFKACVTVRIKGNFFRTCFFFLLEFHELVPNVRKDPMKTRRTDF